MMADQGTILVPLDGSPLGEWALLYAEALAAARHDPVRLLRVVEAEPRGITARGERAAIARDEQDRAEAAGYLDELAREPRTRGIEVSTEVVIGDPVETILERAPRAGVVVMATRGAGGVDRWLIGSVADKVMRLAAVPVLLVRPPYTAIPRRTVALRRLMVPLDGSQLAEAALEPAVDLATRAGAALTLIRVEPWRTGRWGPDPSSAAYRAIDEEVTAAGVAYLNTAREKLPASLDVETVLLRGWVAESIVEFAFHEKVDLTVMTAHGRGGFRRFVLGSTADRVIRSGVPTLLLRPSSAAGKDSPAT
jgi:nucleotide-binding universal stress UspA family protein